ncbi:MAG TPA: phospho-sugar mutase [Patescibacteria group bacterium]|nr:phospho-sugar mutase [Patescibacteria group bacterium]
MTENTFLSKAKDGFQTLAVSDIYKEKAYRFLTEWLTKPQFAEYVPQITHMIQKSYWDYLLDSFYQIIPFGTGGRRGEVGIGPNRINPWTIQSSAQGHSQYLLSYYGQDAEKRGVVLAYDVRQFFTNQFFNDDLPNPVHNLNCKDLALEAAKVYAANGIKVYLFDNVRTTPELSFAIRYLHAVGGDMFSASHNPPEHNGKKVYDEHGGQLIPPFDEQLVDEVTKRVKETKRIDLEEAKKKGLILFIGREVDNAYVNEAVKVSLSQARDIRIVYTPLHGCGSTSVTKALRILGFTVDEDPLTSIPSGAFEHVTFNIPNPEVEQSFDTPLKYAKTKNADIILNSDPDADRIGIMVHHEGSWVFLNGNEIAAVLGEYVTTKRKESLKAQGIMIKTEVTTNLIREICHAHNFRLIGDLLVGFKYIADEMNKLEGRGEIDNFLFACEESHGYLAGNYVRDKDSVIPAIWLSELAAELKKEGKTLVDYLNDVYARYGYFRNYLTEIRLPGAEGKTKIDAIQDALRIHPPKQFGTFNVKNSEDFLMRTPILSETDRQSKNVLAFHFTPLNGTKSLKVTVRPSGTEPKIKMYFEIGSTPFKKEDIYKVKTSIEEILTRLEIAFMQECYKAIDVIFPERGFLLFWQLPLQSKLTYFEKENEIASLKNINDASLRRKKLMELVSFLGSDPVEKVDKAFEKKYGKPLLTYLELEKKGNQ